MTSETNTEHIGIGVFIGTATGIIFFIGILIGACMVKRPKIANYHKYTVKEKSVSVGQGNGLYYIVILSDSVGYTETFYVSESEYIKYHIGDILP
ncbi:MAG: hypothetical protein EBX41_02060 [Chitinophagia bacterium]|nr:hypothetical protein [Chitinophagia bacterium]